MPTLADAISLYTKKGYEVRTDTGERATLIKPKRWSMFLLFLSIIGLIAGVVPGLVFGVLLVLDYAIKKEITVTLTRESVAGGIPRPENPTLRILLIVGVLLFACTALVLLGSLPSL